MQEFSISKEKNFLRYLDLLYSDYKKYLIIIFVKDTLGRYLNYDFALMPPLLK